MNVIISFIYQGKKYKGFQKQAGGEESITIQKVLEKKLKEILKTPIKLIASGRTDRGVHANNQVATFKVEKELIKKIGFIKIPSILNKILPEDIHITKAQEVSEDFNARYEAKIRVYRYSLIINERYYQTAEQLAHFFLYPYPLKVKKLEKYFKVLEGEYDFTTFSAAKTSIKNKVRRVYKIDLIERPPCLFIDIYGNAFLRSMIRSLVGNVLYACRKNYTIGTLKQWLKEKNPQVAKNRVPAKGLNLKKVYYTNFYE